MSRKLLIGTVLVAGALATTSASTQAASPAHYYANGLGEGARIKGGEKVPVIAWGTLSLTNLTTGGKVTCRDIVASAYENPGPGGAEGPPGVGETQSFGAYECESEECPDSAIGVVGGGPGTYISIFAEGSEGPFPGTGSGTMTAPSAPNTEEEPLAASGDDLRWPVRLIEEAGKLRQETQAIKLHIICHLFYPEEANAFNEKHEPMYRQQFGEIARGGVRPLTRTQCCSKGIPPGLEFDAGSGSLENEAHQKFKIEGTLKTLGYYAEEIINILRG